jgi:hypothetical protein
MSINATTSSSVSSTGSSSQVSSAASSDVSKKSTDSSFKEEMDKVSNPEKTEEAKVEKESDAKVNEVAEKSEKNNENSVLNKDEQTAQFAPENAKNVTLAMMDMNNQLSNDIQKMVNTNNVNSLSQVSDVKGLSGAITLDFSPASSISMTQADAEFFVNLTQQNDVSAQNVVAQAQNLLNSGADVPQVKQSAQISQTLLNDLMTAKENNQPLRIDFDQNISVILRVGKDGALAANFIPGDKAVEQYLRNNIEVLKATFKEQDLPYSDLSYSNRGSKQQKENRRNKQ